MKKQKKPVPSAEAEPVIKKQPLLKRLLFGAERPDLSELEAGSTTILDILSPTAIDTKSRDYIVVDGVFHVYLYITGYGYSTTVGSCWLAPLVEAGEGVNVSFSFTRQNREKILSKIAQTTMLNRSRMRDVGDTRQDYEELDSAITSGLYLKDVMNRQGEDFYYMLSLLTLSAEHRENLRERGLSDDRIDQNQYRSMPQTQEGRKLLASLLRSTGHDLQGIPGFRTSYGEWTLSGPNGFLIPVRDKDGLIQGMKMRLDEGEPSRKYRWLSSRNAPNGTRSYSWTHVTGSIASKRAYITEGPLKGDVASYLDNDALFVCIGGVFALHGLKDTLISLGVTEVVEAMDMDQMTNLQVRRAIQSIRQEVQGIRGIRYSKYVWNPAYKGIDDYYLSRIAAQ